MFPKKHHLSHNRSLFSVPRRLAPCNFVLTGRDSRDCRAGGASKQGTSQRPLNRSVMNGAVRCCLFFCAALLSGVIFCKVGLAAPLALSTSSGASAPSSLSVEEARQGWLQLFDGQTTFGWTPSGAAWKVVNGVLVSDTSADSRLRTDTAFANFHLRFEARMSGPAFLTFRVDPSSKPAQPGYRLALNDGTIAGLRGKPVRTAASDWNTYEIDALDDHITTTVNGTPVMDVRDSKNRVGQLEFLANGGAKLEIRSMKLRPLNLDSIYNGANLDGWKAVVPPQPQQGSKLSLPIPGLGKSKPPKPATWTGQGVIHGEGGVGRLETANAYDDFVLRLSIKAGGVGELFFRGDAGQFASGYPLKIDNAAGRNRKPRNSGTGGLPKLQAARTVPANDGEFFTETVVVRARRIAVWVNGIQVTDYYDSRPEGVYHGAAGPLGLRISDQHVKFDFRDISVAVLSKGPQPPAAPAPAVAVASPGIASAEQKMQQEQQVRTLTEQALATQDPEEAVRINKQILLLDPNDVPAQQRLDRAQEKLDKLKADREQAEHQQQTSAAESQATAQRKDELVHQAQESLVAGRLNDAQKQLNDAKRLGASGTEVDRLDTVLREGLRDRFITRAGIGGGAALLIIGLMVFLWRRRGRTLMPYLVTVDGVDAGQRYFLGQEVTHVGAVATDAGKTNQIVVRDPDRMVSRFHCEVHRRGNSFYVVDLNSSNGTFLRSKRLKPGEPVRIRNGERISLGKVAVFELSLERSQASSANSPAERPSRPVGASR